MSDSSSPDNVSMEFQGPVPGVLGAAGGYHVVFWVQASGGASFTRPSQDERDYYAEMGKAVPEWQCEYFEFDGMTWVEATLTVELWRGPEKLRSLFAGGRQGRNEAELRMELPDLDHFVQKNGLNLADLQLSFREALLRAAETAGVIKRGLVDAAPRSNAATQVLATGESWWRRALRRALPSRRVA